MAIPAHRPPATDPAAARAAFAARARQIRQDRGLTIQEVASRAGLAVSTVSKIERNLMAPTYDRFSQLALGLGVDLAELFADSGRTFSPGAFQVCRPGDEGYLETENYTYEMLFPNLSGRTMTPMLGTLKPDQEMRFDRMVSHPGEEFLFVIEGEVVVRAEGLHEVRLKAGESLYFDSGRGHLYASAADRPARILCVCTGLERARSEVDPHPVGPED